MKSADTGSVVTAYRDGWLAQIVQERLGHSSIQMTLGTYSHVTPGLQEAAALSFENGLESTTQVATSRQ